MRRSKTQLLAAIVSAAYAIYLITYFADISADDVSGALAAAIVMPHMICCALGAIFSVVAFFNNSRGLALTAPIMFCVGAVLFTMYAPYTIPAILLGFIGYSKICSIHKDASK